MYAVQDLVQLDEPSSWYSPCAICAGAVYTRRCDRTSVYLCASSQQNRLVQQDFYCLIRIYLEDLGDPVFDGVALAGFKSRANAFLLAWLLALYLSPTVFIFSSFILWVDIVGLRSSD